MRFLTARDKVKVTIMFRGGEMAHPERGEIVLNRLAADLSELAVVEQRPQQDGRNMTMMLGPSKEVAETATVERPDDEPQKARKAGQQHRPAGSALPADIDPDLI